jgi:hypothetical protein
LTDLDSASLRGRPISCTSTETPPRRSLPTGSRASGVGVSGCGCSEGDNEELSTSNRTSAAAEDSYTESGGRIRKPSRVCGMLQYPQRKVPCLRFSLRRCLLIHIIYRRLYLSMALSSTQVMRPLMISCVMGSGSSSVSHPLISRPFDKYRKFQITLIPQLQASLCYGVG